ncbi:MAG: hypothetical protein ABS46_15350 [Cytophagaceae bacterium SCN 52-12]|nr:MAG: hypothetical protein ABS46_15350 [Cytophagaceae bacterium SCN 52-12]
MLFCVSSAKVHLPSKSCNKVKSRTRALLLLVHKWKDVLQDLLRSKEGEARKEFASFHTMDIMKRFPYIN